MTEAFANCTNLNDIRFPSQLYYLGQGAFGKCKRLESISFDKESQLQTIADDAFSDCRGLHDLELPGHLESIAYEAFYKCDNLQHVRLPDTLKHIGDRAFYQCGLQDIQLPQELEYIGDSAFLKCKQLTYISIPTSVKYLGKWAFHGCNRLQMLEIHHDPDILGEWITNKNCIIRCVKGSRVAAYAEKNNLPVEYI